jgi:hypothetical protein
MRIVSVIVLLMCVFAPGPMDVRAGGFKSYPGATLDEKASLDANAALDTAAGTCKLTIYLSPDPYDKVVHFYKAHGREHSIFANVPTFKGLLPGGKELRKTAVILDGADDIADTRLWVQIQRPFILDVKMTGHTPEFRDVRDLTGITLIAGQCSG